MEKLKEENKEKDDLSHLDFDELHVGSVTDCTGLIPSALKSEDELDSYKELHILGADSEGEKI